MKRVRSGSRTPQVGRPDHIGDGLEVAILSLPSNLRDVFLLSRMAGLDYEAIAQHLRMDEAAVQAALSDAMVRLLEASGSGEP